MLTVTVQESLDEECWPDEGYPSETDTTKHALAERQAAALERIALQLETIGTVDLPVFIGQMQTLAIWLERIHGQMEQRP